MGQSFLPVRPCLRRGYWCVVWTHDKASLHGIVSLEVTSKVGAGESVLSLTESLIDNYVFALTERGARIAAN